MKDKLLTKDINHILILLEKELGKNGKDLKWFEQKYNDLNNTL
jgi:hypothetical protein